ncbi:5628_t:CDS:2, partial [Cetraspora pellucida]
KNITRINDLWGLPTSNFGQSIIARTSQKIIVKGNRDKKTEPGRIIVDRELQTR